MLVRKHDIVCRQAVELVTDYLEGVLTRTQRRRFERHLANCPHCTEYLAQIRATIALAGSVESDDLPTHMQRDLTELYRSWRSEEDH